MRPRDSRAGSPDRVVFALVMPGLGLRVAVVPYAGAVVRADHLHTEPDPLAARPVDRRLCILDSHREAVELTGAGEVHADRCRVGGQDAEDVATRRATAVDLGRQAGTGAALVRAALGRGKAGGTATP